MIDALRVKSLYWTASESEMSDKIRERRSGGRSLRPAIPDCAKRAPSAHLPGNITTARSPTYKCACCGTPLSTPTQSSTPAPEAKLHRAGQRRKRAHGIGQEPLHEANRSPVRQMRCAPRHVFDDGPDRPPRYCINSASLKRDDRIAVSRLVSSSPQSAISPQSAVAPSRQSAVQSAVRS